jgi:ribonuclease HI
MFNELGGEDALIIATDGSFCPKSSRAGWGFTAYKDHIKVAEGKGAHKLYTSSTRMEVEAANRALEWLASYNPGTCTVIIATDSIAMLSRMLNGWLPTAWRDPDKIPTMDHVIWTYVPGHAGVSVNEEADHLAAQETNCTPLELFHSDVKLWSEQQAKQRVIDDNLGTYEGDRFLLHDIQYGQSCSSKVRGPRRWRLNQISTGHISNATLQHLLMHCDMGKGVNISGCAPADPCLAADSR